MSSKKEKNFDSKKIDLSVEIHLNELAYTLVDHLTYEELFLFIKKIELTVASWDFLNMLKKYVDEATHEFIKEFPEE